MEKNDKTKTIIIHEGIGNDAIEMMVQVTQEEFDKMEQIRKFSPANWEGRDLELLQEARKILSEKLNEPPVTEQVNEQPMPVKDEPKRNNSGLWWALGVIIVLFIGYEAFLLYVKQQTKDVVQRAVLNHTKNTLNYNGVSFDYPDNWSFVKNNTSDDVFMIEGGNEMGSEYVVMVSPSTAFMSVEDCIDATIDGFADIDEAGGNIEYSAIYDAQFNGRDALAAECNYKYKGKNCFGIVKGFEFYGKNITIIATAYNQNALAGDDFKIMENSFKYTKTN